MRASWPPVVLQPRLTQQEQAGSSSLNGVLQMCGGSSRPAGSCHEHVHTRNPCLTGLNRGITGPWNNGIRSVLRSELVDGRAGAAIFDEIETLTRMGVAASKKRCWATNDPFRKTLVVCPINKRVHRP